MTLSQNPMLLFISVFLFLGAASCLWAVVADDDVQVQGNYLDWTFTPDEGGALTTLHILGTADNLAGQAGLLQEGFGVRLRGVVCTSANGERLLRADPAYVQIVPSPLIVPLGMANGSVGGGDFLFEAGLWPSGQEGIPGMHGANNTGLLVRTWGRVTEIDPAPLPEFPKWLRIEDGSRRNIKCTVTEEILLSPIWLGRFVSVTGISSCERDAAEQLVPIVKLKRPDDLLSLE